MQTAKSYIKRDIEKAAKSLFYTKGYAKVPMREIAEVARVSLGNIYNYYESKEELFFTIVRPAIDDFERMLHRHHGQFGPDITEVFTERYLRTVIDEYLSLIGQHRDSLFLLLFRSEGTAVERFKYDFSDRSTAIVKEYFSNMKRKHPDINTDISAFTVRLHTIWMFSMLEELLVHRRTPDETEKIVTEYLIFCTTGWRELMKG